MDQVEHLGLRPVCVFLNPVELQRFRRGPPRLIQSSDEAGAFCDLVELGLVVHETNYLKQWRRKALV